MRVQDLMTKTPEACLPGDSCAMAGEIMRRRNCGFVPVVDGHITNQVIGVVTDRDLALRLAGSDRTAHRVRVAECMTATVHAIEPEATLEDATNMMARYAIHRLPVVRNRQLVGVLSLSDIARVTDERLGFSEWREAEQKVLEVVEAIATTQ